jgi:PAS domain S-box-containing protein
MAVDDPSGSPSEAERALRASEERYRALVNASSDVVYRVSPDWTEVRQLDGRKFIPDTGRPSSDWLEKYIFPADQTRVMESIREAIRTKGIFELEHRVVRVDGTVGWASSRAVPILDEHGEIVEWVGTASDVTPRKQADESLEQQRRLYEAILDNTPDLAYVWDLDHRFIYANQALLKMWGRTWEEAIGRNCLQLGYEPWHAAMHDREIDQVVATKQPVRGEVPFTGTAGRRIYDYLLMPVLGANGEVEAVAGTTRDITERRRSEQALRDSEERLQLALMAGQSGVWDWALDSNIATVSSYYRELYGLAADVSVNYETWLGTVHAEDRERARAYTEDFFRSGTEFRLDFRIVHPQRGERWLRGIGLLERDETGQPRRFIGVNFDLTEQKHAEQALRVAQERLTSALAASRMATWDWDTVTDLLITSDSIRDLYGLLPEEPLRTGEQASKIVHPDDLPRHRAIAEAAVRAGGSWHHELRIVRPRDGRTIWVEERAHVLRETLSGRVTVSGLVWDITQRKELEASLREADRRKDEFLATLAHELRNPLAPIRNAVHLMKVTNPTDAKIRTARDIIDRQVQHMVRLVDDLLEVSRITLGQVSLRHDTVSLRSLLSDALETAGPLIEAAGHGLVVQLPAEVLQLEGDATRLSQVFQNLLDNATKYTPRGGQITLRAERHGREVRVSVRDTGIGIPKEAQERVFDLFTRVHPSDPIKSSGLGIGLALAKQLVELHNGRIEVRSGGRDAGSEFIVHLPVLDAAASVYEPAASTATAQTRGNKQHVLVVDDNQDAARSLAMLLEMSGCTVSVAFGGREALDTLETFPADVVLLDIGMPGMDGYEVARRIRSRPCEKELLLIALTGWGQAEDKRRAAEAGFDEHLTKPVDPELLATLLNVERAAG